MIEKIQHLAEHVGKHVVEISQQDMHVSKKSDGSPITIADRLSHDMLCEELPRILDIPILSEENPCVFEKRKHWDTFWLIDPLDGTKEFLAGDNEYCINIALIAGTDPIVGVIHAPALGETYAAEKGKGFRTFGTTSHKRQDDLVIVGTSRFHHSFETQNFMENNSFATACPMGAALKFCRLAVGEIDIYPRFQGSSEWDIAAGHLIIEEAGGYVTDLTTNAKPVYNKESLRNHHFIAARNHIDFKSLII